MDVHWAKPVAIPIKKVSDEEFKATVDRKKKIDGVFQALQETVQIGYWDLPKGAHRAREFAKYIGVEDTYMLKDFVSRWAEFLKANGWRFVRVEERCLAKNYGGLFPAAYGLNFYAGDFTLEFHPRRYARSDMRGASGLITITRSDRDDNTVKIAEGFSEPLDANFIRTRELESWVEIMPSFMIMAINSCLKVSFQEEYALRERAFQIMVDRIVSQAHSEKFAVLLQDQEISAAMIGVLSGIDDADLDLVRKLSGVNFDASKVFLGIIEDLRKGTPSAL